ncbi:O-antigen ligase family protein [Rubellicoccus peritrichatus]|uniref:O-antigen ligase family protein n=1 Tax=Rubellicoccus peritrichatus TaxID=3080537 RepID=A0AAQ3LDE0_9BACT|nr:O-antigen ligase family protein [Puniceicoccus sp. CR14]WOO43421.1 O-antigen ligase family protein [Puniceicoccus sp. CR14]
MPTTVGRYALVLGLLLLLLFGGGAPIWAQSLVLIIGGFWAVLHPPLKTPSRKMDWALIVFTLWSLTAFLPSGLLGKPSWHENMAEVGWEPGWFTTGQPWFSAELIVILLAGITWFYLIWNLKIDYDDRRRLLWVFVVGMALLGLGASWGSLNGYRSPYQAEGLSFSYFPNKNHSGLVLAMGAVAAFALTVHMMRCRRRSGFIAFVCLLFSFSGVIFSMSRAGLILFFVGAIASYLIAFNVRRSIRLLRYVAPLIVLVMSVLLILGRDSLERFSFWTDFDSASDLRIGIYRDTFEMITKLPPVALTIGNFSAVFPQFRDASVVGQSIIHPESDWMWVMAELGVPGFSLLAIAVLVALARYIPFGSDRTMAYRAIAFGPVVIFLIHSLIDVPAHRFGAILLAFLFYRLSVAERAGELRSVTPQFVYRLFGFVLIIAGSAWLVGSVFNLPWNSRIADEKAREALSVEFASGAKDRIAEALELGMSARPLDWWYYTMRARYKLSYERDAEGAREDFLIARALEPISAEVPFQEGVTWLSFNHRMAVDAWREALQRKSLVPISLYREMLDKAGQRPRFNRELANLTILEPDFRVLYLKRRSGSDFDEAIIYELDRDPTFSMYSPAQKDTIFQRWALSGDGSNLRHHLLSFPEISDIAWYYSGLSLAAEGKYEAAIDEVKPFLPAPRFPEFTQFSIVSDQELRQTFIINPDDLVRGSILLKRQLDRSDLEGATETLGILFKAKDIPDYVLYWKGELERSRGQYRKAWNTWEPYLKSYVQEHIVRASKE